MHNADAAKIAATEQWRRAGFRSTALMATLPGVRLYQECGYAGEDSVDFPLPGGLRITFVPMGKVLA